MSFRLANEVEAIAKELISEHHPHLFGVRMTYVFLNKTPKSKGKDVWGRAKKVSGLPAFLVFAEQAREVAERWGADEEDPLDFFVIEVSEEVWEKLTEKGRRALVDEQLSACEIEEDEEGRVSLVVVGPDVSGFSAVVRRHGLWREDLEDFVRAGAEQLPLLPEDGSGGFSREVVEAAEELRDMGAEMTVGLPNARKADPLERATPDGDGAEEEAPVPGGSETFEFTSADTKVLAGAARHLRSIGGNE